MAERQQPEKKRGPKGGVKHQPGRDHARKSGRQKKERFRKKAARKRREREKEARRQWAEWDGMDEEQRKFFPDRKPTMPRPSDD